MARRGNIIFTTLSMHLDAHAAIATHIPGNRLSRHVSATDLDIDASKEYDASSDLAFIFVVQLCDPDAVEEYDSIWKTWTLFMQICHHNPSEDQINCTDITQQQLLKLLLMFLKKALTSIPGILSGLKNNLVLRFVPLEAFDNSLLVAMKASVKDLPYSPRVRLPCTYSMVLYIIQQNTQPQGNKDRFMLAVGASEHASVRANMFPKQRYQTRSPTNSTLNQWSSNVLTPAP